MAGRGLYRHPPQPQSQDPRRHTGLLFAPTAGAYNAVTGNPTSATIDFVCGFEDAAISTHWGIDLLNGATGALDSTIAGRTGTNAARLDLTDVAELQTIYQQWTARAVSVATFRFRVSTLPTGSTRVWKFNGASVYDSSITLASNGVLQFVMGGTAANSASPIVANTWYQIDVAVDGTNKIGRWSIDGVAQTNPGSPASTDTNNGIYLGKSSLTATGAFSYYFDDVAVSATWADYPLSPGVVRSGTEAWIEPDTITVSDSVSAIKTINRTASDALGVHTGRPGAPPTVVFACGGEAASEPGATTHWDTATGSVTKDATHVRSGSNALKFVTAASASYLTKSITAGKRALVVRFAIYMTDYPASGVRQLWEWGPDFNYARINTSGSVILVGGATSLAPLPLNQWVTIDFTVDASAATHVQDWKINGVSQPQQTNASTAADIGTFVLGDGSTTSTATWWVDDLVLSTTAGDYPIADGEVPGTAPESWLTYEQVQGTKNLVRTASDTVTVAAVPTRTGAFLRSTVNPTTATIAFTCGGEHASEFTTSHWFSYIPNAGAVTVDTTHVDSSPNAIKITADAYLRKIANTGTYFAARLRIWLPSGAASGTRIIELDDGAQRLLQYSTVAGKMQWYNGTDSTAAFPLDQWVTVDLEIDASANPHVSNWRINGVAQPQATAAVAANNVVQYYLGAGSGGVGADRWVDNLAVSLTPGDYPIRAGFAQLSSGGTETWITPDGITTSDSASQVKTLNRTASDTVGLSYAPAVTTDSPIAYWRLGEATTATQPVDETGNITTAVWDGSPTLGVAGALRGDANTSIQLAANGAFKTVGTEPSLALGSGAQSYEIWYRHTGVNEPYLLVSGTNQPEIRLVPGASEIRFRPTTAGSYAFATLPADTNWHHVVGVKQSSTSYNVYVDGVAGTASTSGTWATGGLPLIFPDSFSGGIDEVAIYNYALTPAQILDHYTAGSNGGGATTKTLNRTASDTSTVATTVARTGTFSRTAADAVTTSDAAVGIKGLNRTASDTVTTSSTVTRTGTFTRTGADTLTTSSTVARTGSFARSVADTVTTSSTVDSLEGYVRTASDTVTISSAANPVITGGAQNLNRSANDSVSVSGGTAAAGVFQASIFQNNIFQTGGISGTPDTVNAVVSAPRTASDSVTTTSTAARSVAYIRSFNDTVTVASTVATTKTTSRTASDTATVSTSVEPDKTTSRTVADSVTTSDAATRTVSLVRSAADTVTIATAVEPDEINLLSVADTLTLASTVTRTQVLVRSASDAVTTSDAASKTAAFTRSTADTLTLASTVSRTGTFTRTAADAVTTSDAVTRTGTFTRNTNDTLTTSSSVSSTEGNSRSATDSVTLTDAVSRSLTATRSANDTVTTTDSASQVRTVIRSASDSVTTSDSASRTASFARTAADTVTLASAVSTTNVTSRTVADTLTLATSVARTGLFSRTGSDAVTTSDAISRTGTFSRTASDAITTSDSATKTSSQARTASDSVTTSDAITRTGTFSRTVADTVTLATSVAGAAGASAAASDTVTLATSVARTGTFSRTVTDAVTTSDTATQTRNIVRSAADTLTLASAVTRTGSLTRTAADSITTSSTVAKTGSFTRTASDTLTVAASPARTGAFNRTAADSITTATSVTRTGTFTRTAADTLTLASTVARTVAWVRSSSDTLSAVGTVARTGSFQRVATDTVSLATNVAGVTGEAQSANDTLTLATSVARTGSFARSAADTLTTSSTVSSVKAVSRTASDAVTTTSTAAKTGTFTRSAADAVTTNDTVTKATVTARTASDAVTTTSTAVRIESVVRPFTDEVTLSDSVSVQVVSGATTVADSITLSTTVSASRSVSRIASDSVSFTDAVQALTAEAILATDSVTTSDFVDVEVTLNRSASDTIDLTDEVATGGQLLFRTAEDLVHFSSYLGRPRRGQIPSHLTPGPGTDDGRVTSTLERRNIPSSLRNGKIPAEVS